MGEPVKIAIVLEAGRFSDCLTAGVPVDFVVVEYDPAPDDAAHSESELVDMPRRHGGSALAYVWDGSATPAGPFVGQALDVAERLADLRPADPLAELAPDLRARLVDEMGFEASFNGGGCYVLESMGARGHRVWVSASDCGDLPSPDDWRVCAFPPFPENDVSEPYFTLSSADDGLRGGLTVAEAASLALSLLAMREGH